MNANFQVTLADRSNAWGGGKSETFLTSGEMLAAAGLAGWNVRKASLYAGRKGPEVPNRFAHVTSDGRVLGIASSGYKILQNEEAFGFGDAIVDAGGAHWERAGSLRGGETVFGCMELEDLDIDVPGDDGGIRPYLFIVNSFGGWAPYSGILAYVRPRCQNTFQMAYGTNTPHRFSIRHTSTLDGKLQMARDALGIAFRHNVEVKAIVDRLAMARIVDAQVEELFSKVVWPISDDAPQGMKDNSNASKAYTNYLTSETLDGVRGTAWGAYNAVTEYVDHLTEYKPRKGEGYQTGGADSLRTMSVMLDGGAKRKDAALKALMALSK